MMYGVEFTNGDVTFIRLHEDYDRGLLTGGVVKCDEVTRDGEVLRKVLLNTNYIRKWWEIKEVNGGDK